MTPEAVVLAKVGGGYRVFADGITRTAALRGRLKHTSEDQVLVGDRVTVDVSPDGSATIERIHSSWLARCEPPTGRRN